MDMQSRIKLTIGDMFVQLAAAHAQIDELNEKLKRYEEHDDQKNMGAPKANGHEKHAE